MFRKLIPYLASLSIGLNVSLSLQLAEKNKAPKEQQTQKIELSVDGKVQYFDYNPTPDSSLHIICDNGELTNLQVLPH